MAETDKGCSPKSRYQNLRSIDLSWICLQVNMRKIGLQGKEGSGSNLFSSLFFLPTVPCSLLTCRWSLRENSPESFLPQPNKCLVSHHGKNYNQLVNSHHWKYSNSPSRGWECAYDRETDTTNFFSFRKPIFKCFTPNVTFIEGVCHVLPPPPQALTPGPPDKDIRWPLIQWNMDKECGMWVFFLTPTVDLHFLHGGRPEKALASLKMSYCPVNKLINLHTNL